MLGNVNKLRKEKIRELNVKNFNSFVENGNCIIDFYADWCGPCKILAPEFEKASEKIEEVKFGKVDIDGNQELAERFQVMSIPTILFFKNKELLNFTKSTIFRTSVGSQINNPPLTFKIRPLSLQKDLSRSLGGVRRCIWL